MSFSYGSRHYNRYRKRCYSNTMAQRRDYAQQMEDLEQSFDSLDDWNLSVMKDSAYRDYGNFELRLSNHKADYVHDLTGNSGLIVNAKMSKLAFVEFIEDDAQDLVEAINTLDLKQYRFINYVNGSLHCYLVGYKTKRDDFSLYKLRKTKQQKVLTN